MILVGLPQSPVLAPVTGITYQDPLHGILQNDKIPSGVENLAPTHKVQRGSSFCLNFYKKDEFICLSGSCSFCKFIFRSLICCQR